MSGLNIPRLGLMIGKALGGIDSENYFSIYIYIYSTYQCVI